MGADTFDPYANPPLDDEAARADAEADALLAIAADPVLAEAHVQRQVRRYMEQHPEADRDAIEARFRELARQEAISPDITPRFGLGS